MFKNFQQKCLAFNLRVCCILLCVVLPSYTELASDEEFSKKHNPYADLAVFKQPPDWELAPLGKSASEFLQIFFTYSTTGAIRSTVQADIKDWNKFVDSVIVYTFLHQIPMTITVSLGLLGVLLLLLLPCFIIYYRSRQSAILEERELESTVISRRKGLLVCEFIFIFLAVSVFGGILMCFAIVEFGKNLPDVFDFATFTVDTSYRVKGIITYNFHYSLFDVSRTAFESIQVMYDVNDGIGEKFMDQVGYRIKPVRYLAKSIQWDIMGIENILKNDRKQFANLSKATEEVIDKYVNEYKTTLSGLKNIFDDDNASKTFGSVIEPLSQFSDFNSSNTTLENFDKSIQKLGEVSKIDFQARIQNFSKSLYDSVAYPNYDPSEVMEKLRQVAFDTEQKIRSTIGAYVSYVDRTFKKKNKESVMNQIRAAKEKVLSSFTHVLITTMIFGVLSASLGFCFSLLFCIGLVGTKCFRLRSSGEGIHKSGLSHCSGKLIVFLSYFAVVFLGLFWALSIFIFLMSASPIELCLSAKDKTLFDVTIDHPVFQESQLWYSMYSSPQFNSTLKKNLVSCERDKSYFSVLPDPAINKTVFENIKNELDTDSMRDTIEKVLGDLPSLNISESELSSINFESILDINLHAYFQDLLDFIDEIQKTNASAVLQEIKDHPQSSDRLSSAAQTSIKSYEILIEKLSSSAASEDAFSFVLQATNMTVLMLEKQVEHFAISSEMLVDFLRDNTTSIYMTILNDTLHEMIDAVSYNFEISVLEFRKSISFCNVLNLLYEKFLYLLCERLLYPVSACWIGSFFVDIFLLLAVLLCIYSVPLFLISPKVDSSDEVPSPVIELDEIPSSSNENISEASSGGPPQKTDKVSEPSTSKQSVTSAVSDKNDEDSSVTSKKSAESYVPLGISTNHGEDSTKTVQEEFDDTKTGKLDDNTDKGEKAKNEGNKPIDGSSSGLQNKLLEESLDGSAQNKVPQKSLDDNAQNKPPEEPLDDSAQNKLEGPLGNHA